MTHRLLRTHRCVAIVCGTVGLLHSAVFAGPELVDIKQAIPTIVIDLRYATPNNVTGRPLYPSTMRAYAVPSVVQQLAGAQKFLSSYGARLKIWDAYRPREAQQLLWQLAHKGDYVTNPEGGAGSLHSWGVAVDATLADPWGNDLKMPSRFDEFTPDAAMYYHGTDPIVRSHLRLLQVAMGANKFYGLRIEWWHFVTSDWKAYLPAKEAAKAEQNARAIETENLKPVAPEKKTKS